MRTIGLMLFASFLAACSSSTSVMDTRSIPCGPGEDLEILAGIEGAGQGEMTGTLTYMVEVANNSNAEVTVQTVRVDPSDRKTAGVEGTYQHFDQAIAGGEEFLFKLPVSKTWAAGALEQRT
jgi:hypothetical protein